MEPAERTDNNDGVLGVRFTGSLPPHLSERGSPQGPTVAVERSTAAIVQRRWSEARSPRMLFGRGAPGGPPWVTVERDPVVGYRIWARGLGTHLVALDGAAAWLGAPHTPIGPPESRLVTSQLMPLVAALRGHEVLHAGAVVVGDRLMAITAPSGTGKTSTTIRAVLAGARYFADDSIGLRLAADGVIAHPGPRLMAVPGGQYDSLGPSELEQLGRLLRVGAKTLIEPPQPPAGRPLNTVVLLERIPQSRGGIHHARHSGVELLEAMSLPWLRTPARLVNQLDVVAALDRDVEVLRLTVGARDGPAAVAARLLDHR